MKPIRLLLFVPILLLILLPEPSATGAAAGLLRWYHHILPVLLPFLFLAGILRKMIPLSGRNQRFLLALWGILFGFPVEAITVCSYYKDGKINRSHGQRLMNCFNLPGPAFLWNLAAIRLLKLKRPWLLLISVWITSLVLYLIQSQWEEKKPGKKIIGSSSSGFSEDLTNHSSDQTRSDFSIHIIEEAWMEGCRSILIIGGCLMIFGILTSWMWLLPGIRASVKTILILLMEITTGTELLAQDASLWEIRGIIASCACSFGGLSFLAQTAGCISESDLSMTSYVLTRIASAILAPLVYILLHLL